MEGVFGLLLIYGNVHCDYTWEVDEKNPAGYSRVYYVYDGEVDYTDAEENIRLKPGCLYIFPSVTAYHMKQNINKRLYCTYMHIDFSPSVLSRVVEVQVEKVPALKYMLCSIKESIDANDTRILNKLADVFAVYCMEHKLVPSPDDHISRVLLYISNYIMEKMTVKKLSSLAGYNDQYFIRLFRQRIGMTPYQYIIGCRLKEARKMLITGLQISEIAEMTGYSDIKSFSRAFKSKFGISPSLYRDTYIRQP
jgi:AraC-like DNA-binding protein